MHNIIEKLYWSESIEEVSLWEVEEPNNEFKLVSDLTRNIEIQNEYQESISSNANNFVWAFWNLLITLIINYLFL